MAEQSVPVRITKKRYQRLKRDAEKNGHTLSWLLNFIIDLHYQERARLSQVTGPDVDTHKTEAA